ncbi:hypothetical protein YC2023_017606 [Brassica napus]
MDIKFEIRGAVSERDEGDEAEWRAGIAGYDNGGEFGGGFRGGREIRGFCDVLLSNRHSHFLMEIFFPTNVSNNDVDLASATEAIIFRVIYEFTDDVQNTMEELLESVEEQIPIGSVEVRATFSSVSGRVAGCMVAFFYVLYIEALQ